jgi:uncharacterized phage protein (predicted DNA packaging)
VEISPQQMALVKKHLRVDHDDEDDLIAGYTQASVDFVEHYCDGALVSELTIPAVNEEPPREVIFTAGIWHAILLLTAYWYENREAAGQELTEIPLGVEPLLLRHRKWN